MAYDAFQHADQWQVYQLDAMHVPSGAALGTHVTKQGALDHMKALYAAETDNTRTVQNMKPSNKGYISPRQITLVDHLRYELRRSKVYSEYTRKPGISIFKDDSGRRNMFLVTSNSYRDREREYIPTRALNNYVERSWLTNDVCQPNNELLFWHDGAPIGDVAWADMEGPFLLELAIERKGTVNRAIWDYIEANPQESWGASHGFRYSEKRTAPDGDATYEDIDKFETSVLPLKYAANPYTFSGVIMSEDRDKVLERMGIPIKGLRKGVQDVKTALDEKGIEHKAVKGIMENLSGVVDTFIAKLTDAPAAGLKEELMASIVTALATAEPTTDETVEDVVDAAVDDGMMKAVADARRAKELKLMDALVQTQESLTNDYTALLETVKTLKADMATELKALTPLSQLSTEFKAMTAELEAVKKQLSMRPRVASKADATITNEKDVSREVQAQMTEHSNFWGRPLKGT